MLILALMGRSRGLRVWGAGAKMPFELPILTNTPCRVNQKWITFARFIKDKIGIGDSQCVPNGTKNTIQK